MHIMHEPLFETPNGIIVLPLEHVRKVTDIEEELFFLYTLRLRSKSRVTTPH